MTQASPRFEPIDRQQVVLEPLDVERLIPENHPARNFWAVLGRVDLSRFQSEVKAVEGHAGRSAWEPRLLIALWLSTHIRGASPQPGRWNGNAPTSWDFGG